MNLEDVYTELENSYHLETNVAKKFQSISDNRGNYRLKAEIMAFQFMEKNQNGSNWGTYFGSYARFTKEDGSYVEFPTINDINEEIINHWNSRINQTQNPVLKARYSGLVWDFSNKVLSKKPSHKIAEIYIESLIKIVENKLQNEIDLIYKIKRAFSVAISLKNKSLIEKTKQVMITLEDNIGENDKPGLWGFSFDSLIEHSKSILSQKEQEEILTKLEQRLSEITSSDKVNTWASECVIKRLAPYYRKKNKLDDAQRVLRVHGQAVVKKKQYSMLLQYQAALKDLQKLYAEYGMKQESNILLKEIKKIGAKVLDEMQLFTTKSKISQEDIDAVVVPITTGTKTEVFHKIINLFIPRKDLIVEALEKQSQDFVISSLFGTSIVDETGREIANIGTVKEDLIGNILHYISQDLQFNLNYAIGFQNFE